MTKKMDEVFFYNPRITMRDIINKKDEIEESRKKRGKKDFAFKTNFDPNAVDRDFWVSFYDEFKIFFPTLTKERLREILYEYRKGYNTV